ncbi:MAG: vanadium-dependent haloperoxidase [Pseudomonadota bacterium]
MTDNRALTARRIREDAAELAYQRHHPAHQANGDEQRLASVNYAMSFTKGLDHDPVTGLVNEPRHFEAFRGAIDEGRAEAFTTRVPVPLPAPGDDFGRRQWEAPTAGVVYDLEGPDAQAVTMAPAPPLGSDELAFEMAEVYELALVRDVPFHLFDAAGGAGSAPITAGIDRMNALPYAQAGFPGRPRKTEGGALTLQTVFRGSSPGVDEGPYLSQFMLMGTAFPGEAGITLPEHLERGQIAYGAQCIPQKVLTAEKELDFMQDKDNWLHVQQGFTPLEEAVISTEKRFINTPRDLATYVHFDALYQAYLNATLMMLNLGTPFDPGFAALSGMRPIYDLNPSMDGRHLNAGGFALYGGPHILTLVTEVATRALKAVRFQKFNNHLRARPEALAGRIQCAEEIECAHQTACGAFSDLRDGISDTVDAVREFNNDRVGLSTALLPMAFAEGSPMHPAYGAGHATVAGACVTILKAYFDCGARLGVNPDGSHGFFKDIVNDSGFFYESMNHGAELAKKQIHCPLSLEGELNKLAANISIGRNMAGVHYFTDYYDSLRMGEEIAIGMLEEQALCYPTDHFALSVPKFDGGVVRIGRR